MEKVKLPQGVAEAIEWCRNHQMYTNYDILQRLTDNTFSNTHAVVIKDFVTYEDHFDILLQALVNGWEIEETPEDKVKFMYYESTSAGFRQGIIATLTVLNITVPGVNTE